MPDALYPYENILAPADNNLVVVVKASDGDEPESYPVNVYNANAVLIGVANTKQEFINIWNSDALNISLGSLTGWYDNFSFLLVTKNAGAPALTADSFSQLGLLVDADQSLLTDHDSFDILYQ